MEILAVISLTGNIIQFINLGFSLVSKGRQIYQSTTGFDSESADLNIVASDIKKISTKLVVDTSLSTELDQIAQACRSVAKELVDALAEIQKKGNEGTVSKPLLKLQSMRKAWKSVWKKDYIEELQRRLDNLRNQITMHMVCNAQNDRIQLYQDMRRWLNSHTGSSRTIMINLGKLATQLQDIQDSIQTNEDGTWASLNDVLPSLKTEVSNVAKSHSVIRSLRFGCMEVRHTAIKSAYNKTFEWIFDPKSLPLKDPRSKISLSEWLEKDAGVFWVTGKPGEILVSSTYSDSSNTKTGAGKSTLMKWLYTHEGAIKRLHTWAGGAKLIRVEFYFWNPGEVMQKSLEGLLQTLLYHILYARPDLIPSLCPKRWHSEFSAGSDDLERRWTLTELKEAFAHFKEQLLAKTKFYFHIDGLDEYNGESYEVIDILQNLVTSPNVKLCLASRPWNAFENAYGTKCKEHIIRLHELTRQDIELFARENLLSYTKGTNFKPRQFNGLIRDIGERAQGVFLWVYLAVRSLGEGIINKDPPPLIQKRLQEIPTDLEEFFQKILSSVDSVYRPIMASTFLAALRAEIPLRIIHYHFMEFGDDTSWYKEDAAVWPKDVVQDKISITQERLNGRFKGLLEPTTTTKMQYSTTVDFLHRTLRDFLRSGPLRTLLESCKQETHVLLSISRALAAEAKFVESRPSSTQLKRAVEYAAVAFQESGDADKYCALLDQIELIRKRVNSPKPGCRINNFMLRSALLAGEVEYVRHCIKKGNGGLDPIVRHVLICQLDQESTLGGLVELEFDNGKSTCNRNGSFPPSLDIIRLLVDHGSIRKAASESIPPLYIFLDHTIRLMDGENSDAYWDVFQCMLDGKAIDPSAWIDQWFAILSRPNLHSHTSSRNTHRYMTGLLEKGLDPNTGVHSHTLFSTVLKIFSSNPLHISSDAKHSQNELLRNFLQHGADVNAIFRGGWLIGLLHRCRCYEDTLATSWTAEVQIFLEQGLDPNASFPDCQSSFWVAVLEVICKVMVTAKTTQQLAFHRCFVMFLDYGADPRAKGVHELMKWMDGDQSGLTNQEKANARSVLDKHLARTRPQETDNPRKSTKANGTNQGQTSHHFKSSNVPTRSPSHNSGSVTNDSVTHGPRRKGRSQFRKTKDNSKQRQNVT